MSQGWTGRDRVARGDIFRGEKKRRGTGHNSGAHRKEGKYILERGSYLRGGEEGEPIAQVNRRR